MAGPARPARTVSTTMKAPGLLAATRAGSGEPLVLLHGIGTWRGDFTRVLPHLRGFDVIALDLPGHGDSPPLAGRPSVAALADAVEAHLDAIGLDTVHLLGNSLGGRIALELAMRQRARSVTAIAPAGTSVGLERVVQLAMLSGMGLMMRAVRPVADRLARAPGGRAVLFAGMRVRPELATPDEAAAVAHNSGTAAYWDTLVWATALDLASPERLSRISCPVLLAQGSADAIIGSQLCWYAACIPTAETTVLPWAGHTAHADVPAQVAALVRATAARQHRPPS